MWLRRFLQDLNVTPGVNDPAEILCDNTATLQFAKDLKFYRKTKHIEVLSFCVRHYKTKVGCH